MKLKTNVYKYDQNIMLLTDLTNNDRISRLIEGRLISLVKIFNVLVKVNEGGSTVLTIVKIKYHNLTSLAP